MKSHIYIIKRFVLALMYIFFVSFFSLNSLSSPIFSDISPTYWFYTYVQDIAKAGITTGYPDGTYRPSALVTRAQMAAFISRALKLNIPDECSSSPFYDIGTNTWYCPYVKAIKDAGVTTGYPDGSYKPDGYVTRAEMAAFLVKALHLNKQPCTTKPFVDVPTDAWYCPYVQAIKDAGITKGYPDGTYRPNEAVTRAIMAAFIDKAFLGGGNGGSSSNNTGSNNIVLKGLEGTYVAVLSNDLIPIQTKEIGADGKVGFSVNQPFVNIAYIVWPGVTVNKNIVFLNFAQTIYDDMKKYCSTNSNSDICNYNFYNLALKWIFIDKSKKIPITFAEDSASVDSNLPQNVSSFDANGDGYLDENEVYNLALSNFDTNGDGRIQAKELEKLKGEYFSILYIVKDFPINKIENLNTSVLSAYNNWNGENEITLPHAQGYFDDYLTHHYKYKKVLVTVNDLPEGVKLNFKNSFEIHEQWLSSSKVLYEVYVPLQSDGTYSIMIYDNNKEYFAKDLNSNSLNLNYNNFADLFSVTLNNEHFCNTRTVEGDLFMFYTIYKNVEYLIKGPKSVFNPNCATNSYSIRLIRSNFGTDYNLSYSYFKYNTSTQSYTAKTKIFDLGKSLPNSFDASYYKNNLPNVELTNFGDNYIELNGQDLSKISEIDIVKLWTEKNLSDNRTFMFSMSYPYANSNRINILNKDKIFAILQTTNSEVKNYIEDIINGYSYGSTGFFLPSIKNYIWGNFNKQMLNWSISIEKQW